LTKQYQILIALVTAKIANVAKHLPSIFALWNCVFRTDVLAAILSVLAATKVEFWLGSKFCLIKCWQIYVTSYIRCSGLIYRLNEVVFLDSSSSVIIFIIYIILLSSKIEWSKRDFLDNQFIHRIPNRHIPLVVVFSHQINLAIALSNIFVIILIHYYSSNLWFWMQLSFGLLFYLLVTLSEAIPSLILYSFL
jgi:hypothetical protein